jgi:hypothetical protein
MTFPENEVVMMILSAGVLVFIVHARTHLRRIAWWRMLVLSYALLMAGWCATVVEHVTGSVVCNDIEHIAYALGAVVFAAWCWRGIRVVEEVE